MRYNTPAILILFIVSGCNVSGERALSVKEYFNLDSLLDHQIQLIAGSGLTLTKKVTLDEKSEEKTFDPDTSFLKGEFKILREFDLNKTNYIGAYDVIEKDNSLRYVLKSDQNSPVESLDIQKNEDGGLREIKGLFLENRKIYQHQREIEISFENGLISSYVIRGYQDMAMKDSIQFLTEGWFR